MSIANLDALFRPKSIAVIGASNQPKNPGSIVMRNLLSGQFLGPVMPVSTKFEAIYGVLTYKSIEDLPLPPDLAVICQEAEAVPETLDRLGARGARGAILLSASLARAEPGRQKALSADTLAAARRRGMRLLGPGCLGLIVPGYGLNASLAQTSASPGRTAFITQSDSLFTTVLDWAKANDIGFSHFISLGDQLDADFAACLDYLGSDPATRSILLYVESISDARRFMSAARASARNKPILVLKPGTVEAGNLPEGICLIKPDDESDAIYDVAFRRAGLVRVNGVDALFDGARTLVRTQAILGDKLAILTNGRSVGLLAADACLKGGAGLAAFSAETRQALAGLLGARRAENPVVLPFDAPGETYDQAMAILVKDRSVAAMLVLHVPFADVPVEDTARAVAAAAARTKRPVLTCWLGSDAKRSGRQIFSEAQVPTFDSPDKAIHAFLHMVTYRRNQDLLLETPDSLPPDFFPDTSRAKAIIEVALGEGRSLLSESEAKDLLGCYGVPVVGTRVCVSAMEAVIAADELGYPVALKVRSPQIPQPYDVGGVTLDLNTPEQVWDAAARMVVRVHKVMPEAEIAGYVVQQMGRRPGAHELFVGAFVDPVFGPVIRFGHGGLAMSLIRDQAVALPPLNMALALELIERTRISKLLDRASPGCDNPTDIDDLCLTLIQLSQLIIDLPQLTSIEVNPLYADDKGVLALSARIVVAPSQASGPDRLAIRPYPRELEECVALKDGRKVLLRPIRPEDAPAHLEFIRTLSAEDLRLRFFGVVRTFEFSDMPKFTQIDYDREMAFIASLDVAGEPRTVGVVRTSTRPDNESAEFAIIVASDMKGQGLGTLLFEKMIRYCRTRGTRVLEGQTLPENSAMIALAKKFGFAVSTNLEEEVVQMHLDLQH